MKNYAFESMVELIFFIPLNKRVGEFLRKSSLISMKL